VAHLLFTGAPVVLLTSFIACGGSKGDHGIQTGRADTAVQSVKLKVSNVMIGKRIGTGKHITEPTFQFAPTDTVYLSVGTSGSGGADHLTAAWRSQTGEVLQQSSQPIPAPGENATFQLSRSKGLKAGTYKVVVFLGNDSADTKVFAVKK